MALPTLVVTPAGSGTTINTLPFGGQATMANSLPMTMASDQPPVTTGAMGAVIAAPAFTRPANTTAYATGQTVANSTAAGSVVPLAFIVARKTGGTGNIYGVRLSSSNAAAVNIPFRLDLFRVSPTTTAGDGTAYAGAVNGVASGYLGSLVTVTDKAFSDGAKGIGTVQSSQGSFVKFDTATGSQTIYGILIVQSSYTPTSGETFNVALTVDQD